MTDVLLKDRPTSSEELLDLVQNTQQSYMIQYYMRSYDKTLNTLKIICETFGSSAVALLGPKKLIDDFTPISLEVAKTKGHPFTFMGSMNILSLTNSKPEYPIPKVVVVFGPYIGEFKEVCDKVNLMLKSHVVRMVIYLAYKNTPNNKMHVF